MLVNNIYYFFTDGAYSSLRNQGGIGIVCLKNDKLILQFNKMFKNTTNNRMELLAVIYALNCIKNKVDEVVIYSDSQYVVKTINDNWKRSKNVDLWKRFDETYSKARTLCDSIKFVWIKGHEDSRWNIFVDNLAVSASHEIH